MADTTATAHVFPSANDVRGSQAAGWGKTMYEKNLGPSLAGALSVGNYCISGNAFPSSSVNLALAIPARLYLIEGRYVSVDAQSISFGASVTSYLYVKLLLDANSNVSSVAFETNTTGTAPSYSVFLGMAVTSGSAITSAYDAWAGITRTALNALAGPVGCATGSTRTHEGSVTVSSNGNYSGIHYYSNFTLNSGVTMTIPAGSGRLVIIASDTITINGTISGSGGGVGAGGSGGVNDGSNGVDGTAQPGGGGGGGANAPPANGGSGGRVLLHGVALSAGGGGGGYATNGSAGTTVTGSSLAFAFMDCVGGASGGGGGGDTVSVGAQGGRGGASIILIAPLIVLASTCTLNTRGENGSNGGAIYRGGGGGGGAGNVYARCRSYVDNGATFTQTGGSGGTWGGSGAGNGGAGAAGVKQILLY
jgi:hypothetical protein